MKYALIISLALNVCLLIAVVRFWPTWGWGRRMPSRKPDFGAVRTCLLEFLAQPEYEGVFALQSFDHRTWLSRALLQYKGGDDQERSAKLREIVAEVSRKCGIPGRSSGVFCDAERRIIGSTVEFGYSREVGYGIDNEFVQEQ